MQFFLQNEGVPSARLPTEEKNDDRRDGSSCDRIIRRNVNTDPVENKMVFSWQPNRMFIAAHSSQGEFTIVYIGIDDTPFDRSNFHLLTYSSQHQLPDDDLQVYYIKV